MPTDQEINETLAKCCGWYVSGKTTIEADDGEHDAFDAPIWTRDIAEGVREHLYGFVHDYLSDLNAMADVRRVIRGRGKQNDFIAALWNACGLPKSFTFWTMRNIDSLFAVIDAPSRVQALAAYEVLKEKCDA